MSDSPHVVVIGAGISGLTTAYSLLSDTARRVDVTVLEAGDTVGGLIRTSPFAGLGAVDEAADAFLTRVPWATELADGLGMSADLTSPTGAHALVWHGKMHPIPGDLLLGVPAKVRSFATSTLISPAGKLRAALEPLLPRTDNNDSIGDFVRKRFGNEIHERLVDPLIGSIYAADTDRFSIAAVPQIASLVGERSMLMAAGRARTAAGTATGPVFASPLSGMGALIETLATRIGQMGGRIRLSNPVTSVERRHQSYVVTTTTDEVAADSVVVASPARHSSQFLRPLDRRAADILASWTHASVVLITMSIPANEWPSHLTGSGYLVPKPDQRWVTAASFGSNKWAHWRPADGSMVLRVSLGRDGLDVMHYDDDTLVNLALADLKLHIGVDFAPTEIRISRWNESFPQYRPFHFRVLEEAENTLRAVAPHIVFAGASYRGIGIPACVQQGRAASQSVHQLLESHA